MGKDMKNTFDRCIKKVEGHLQPSPNPLNLIMKLLGVRFDLLASKF